MKINFLDKCRHMFFIYKYKKQKWKNIVRVDVEHN